MCGVAGMWSSRLAPRDAEAAVRSMGLRLQRRGPDGDGAWAHPAGGPAFAHRRLAIVDLSPAGLQPMVSASGRYTITFNGEVYNHAALRAELAAAGHAPPWRGHSDTEVMLAAIEAWGLQASLARFVGMFAFGLWDEQERTLSLVRDRLGVKPLYVARAAGGVAFASEARALRGVEGVDTSVAPEALAGFVAAGCVVGAQSIYRGVGRVAPGTMLRWSHPLAEPMETRWWSAADVVADGLARPFEGSDEDATAELEALLRDAVGLRMVADVPLGAFLSGGVDSSVVVALMQAQSRAPVHTFSIGSDVAGYDERDAAAAVARHLGTHHTPVVTTAADALTYLPELAAIHDEPFADSSQIATWLVARLARRHVTVALSGDGGDELFGGYVRHVHAARIQALQRVPRRLRHGVAAAIHGVPVARWDALHGALGPLAPPLRLPGVRMHKLATALSADTLEAAYTGVSTHWGPDDGLLLHPAAVPAPPSVPEALSRRPASWMMYRDLVGYLPDDVLTKVDRATMGVSLEAREPLLDHRVLAFAWRLPERLTVGGGVGKRVLRNVLARHVPPALTSGAKMGFAVPLGDWLRGPMRPWAESLLAPVALADTGVFDARVVRTRWEALLAGTRPWEHHLWDVLCFQAWARDPR